MKRGYISILLMVLSGLCFGQVEGTWKLAPKAQALAVGPGLGDFSWWANTADDVEARACFFDDSFVFNADGSFQNVQDGLTWLEVWQGATEDTCGEPVAPHDGSNAATWSYDEDASTITLTGAGAHLGLPKVINDAEITSPDQAASSIAYPVAFSDDGNTMTIDINFGPGFWHFELAKEETNNVEDQLRAEFNFYPNPATTDITVVSEQKMDKISVRDITGKVLISIANPNTKQVINITDLTSGIYLLESQAGSEINTQKLVVR